MYLGLIGWLSWTNPISWVMFIVISMLIILKRPSLILLSVSQNMPLNHCVDLAGFLVTGPSVMGVTLPAVAAPSVTSGLL